MPRASIAFQTVFDEACAACGYTAAEVAAGAALQADMLRRFNEAFQVAVDIPGAGWEDLRQWAEISPVDDLTIDYSVLGDARQFQVNRVIHIDYASCRRGDPEGRDLTST